MGERPTRREQRERNRVRLLAAAEKIFAERGIQGASLEEVAAEADLTKGAVYSNFDGKEDLVLEVMWRRLSSPEDTEVARLLASDRPAEQLIDDYGALWAATVRGGEREHYARVALEFLTHAMRRPEARKRLLALLFPPPEAGRHPLAPEGSELARLPRGHADAILQALDIGLSTLSMLDPEHCPPELYPVALRLLAGMEITESRLPPVAEHPAAEENGTEQR